MELPLGVVPNTTNTGTTMHQTKPANGCTYDDRSCSSCWESRPTGRAWVRRCIKPHLEIVLHTKNDWAVPDGNRSQQDEHGGDGASNCTCEWLYARRPILQFMLGIAPNRASVGAPVHQTPPGNGFASNDRSCSTYWESFQAGRTPRRRCIKPHLQMVVHTTTNPAVHAGNRAQQGAHGCAGVSSPTCKWFCIQRPIVQSLLGIVPNRTNTEATVHQTAPVNGFAYGKRSCSSY